MLLALLKNRWPRLVEAQNGLPDRELPEVIEGLCTLPGVGPKVAACICLFSLDKNQVIHVDTHVWKNENMFCGIKNTFEP